ncbi:MAG: hypothetical protein KDH20_20220 [Rhodocyclaceae bacterium]|nr:hypothetical protein [Rhodocyclaceae bacterium]
MTSGLALAERPMNVDDAGTLDLGGAKVEFGWSKDDRTKGLEAAVGYGPIENVEVELAGGWARDDDADPEQTFKAVGFAVKWVPLQQETGLSAGLKFEYGREKATDDAGLDETATGKAVIALVQWTLGSGQLLHLNLSREWVEVDDDTEAENGWGLGTAYPLSDQLFLVAEAFGSQHGAPDKAVGVRYEIQEGLKLSGEIGRGNDRSFANLGIAWEF